MLIHLYEYVINEDGNRIQGDKLVGEIRCIGDGTPGEIIFFDTCNDIWQVKDPKHYFYTDKTIILDDIDKGMLKNLFNESLNITADGGEVDGVEFSVPATLQPWCRETIEYLLEYEVNRSVCGKIIE